MLLLGTPLEIAGLTVFSDHVSPTTFHYLPGAPRLVPAAGRPGVQLLRYRGSGSGASGAGGLGGGLLTLDVCLGADAGALNQARELLAGRAGGAISLVPVTFNEGRVRLAMLDIDSSPASGDRPASAFLVERVLATAMPALFADARAIMSVALSAEGATLLEQALRTRVLPIVVAYELTLEGLRPARGLRARVDYRMAYDFLRTRAAAGALLFKADVDREAEALQREQLITIEDVDYAGADPEVLAARAEDVRATLGELANTLFFRPASSPSALPPEGPAAQPSLSQTWAGSARAQAAFVLRDMAQQEQATLEYDLTSTRVARQTIAPQGALAALDFMPETAILDVDLSDPGPRAIRAFVPAGADWTGIGAVEVTLQPGDGSTPVSDAVRPDRTEATIAMPPGELSYRTRVLVKPEPDALGAPTELVAALAPLAADTLVLDPAVLAERRVLTVTLGTVDPASRIRVRGSLDRAGVSRPFVLDAARPSMAVPVWGRADVRLSVAIEIDGVVARTDVRDLGSSERLVVINPPRDRVQLVVVELVDPLSRFESVFVEIEAVPDGNRQLVRLDASTPRQEWMAIAAAADPARRYRFKVRKVFKTAQSLDLPWQDGAGQLLLVGDTAVRVVPIEVVLVGAPPDVVAAEITVTSLLPPPDVPAAATIVIEQGTRATVSVPFAPAGAIRYRVEGRIFTETGDAALGPIEDSGEVCLLEVPSKER